MAAGVGATETTGVGVTTDGSVPAGVGVTTEGAVGAGDGATTTAAGAFDTVKAVSELEPPYAFDPAKVAVIT